MEQIIDIIIKIVATLLLAGAGWLGNYIITYLKSSLDAKEVEFLDSFIGEMVAAAEQMYAKNDPDGTKRLRYVCEMLVEAGYETTEAVRAMIEAKVYDINLMNAVKAGETA